MNKKMKIGYALAISLSIAHVAAGGPVTGLANFTAGTPARAGEVNGNFAAVKTAVDDNNSRIGTLLTQLAALQTTVTALQATVSTLQTQATAQQTTITTLQSQVTTLQAQDTTQQSTITTLQAQLTNITPLNGVISLAYPSGVPTVRFSNVNVQVVNGLGSTATLNGTGNLIVGYNEFSGSGAQFCSLGVNPTSGALVTSSAECTTAGGVWNGNQKTGSHNLIVGDQNLYTSYAGVVFGTKNIINYQYATVTGGQQNKSSGQFSSVTGGEFSIAYGRSSSVTAGQTNTASGRFSSVSGGHDNIASGEFSTVSGGTANQATAFYSSVSGGQTRTAAGSNNWVAGALLQSN